MEFAGRRAAVRGACPHNRVVAPSATLVYVQEGSGFSSGQGSWEQGNAGKEGAIYVRPGEVTHASPVCSHTTTKQAFY